VFVSIYLVFIDKSAVMLCRHGGIDMDI